MVSKILASLLTIFSFLSAPTYTPKPSLPPVTLLFTGDVNLARSVNLKIAQKQDFSWPFLKTADFLKSADFTIINLESPLTANCPPTNSGMIFCGDIRNVAGLATAGVDLASLANNHRDNFGPDGVASTKTTLTNNNINFIDQGQIFFQQIKGRPFAFLAYDLVGHPFDKTVFLTQLTQARRQADYLIVIFHWGDEYTAQPNSYQQEIARLSIDNGADLVLGSHPHWVQTTQDYHDKLIVYSHGNFIFDQSWSLPTQQGILGQYTFSNGELASYHLYPIQINADYQPEMVK